jgi:hypothetical protein
MARTALNVIGGGIVGTSGSVVFVRRRDGSTFIRERSTPFDPRSESQVHMRELMRLANGYFRDLDTNEMSQWQRYAEQIAQQAWDERRVVQINPINAYRALAVKFMQVNGLVEPPRLPPVSTFVGDGVVVSATSGSGVRGLGCGIWAQGGGSNDQGLGYPEACEKLPRAGSLETSDGARQGDIQSDRGFAQDGSLRAGESDQASGRFYSDEHCGRLCEAASEGVPAVPKCSGRQPSGADDIADAGSGDTRLSRGDRFDGAMRKRGSHADEAPNVSCNPAADPACGESRLGGGDVGLHKLASLEAARPRSPDPSPQTPSPTASANVLTFTASCPNSPGVVTELLVQPLRLSISNPDPAKYRHRAFVHFEEGHLEAVVDAPSGWVAPAVRFVLAATGQVSALVPLPIVRV